ncbi:MAG: sigma-54-dependent transcriptional regulator [Planctomyces sp.]|jgi:DNA-binding NtrC family response regulator
MPERRRTILLVDDEPLYLRSTAALLRNADFHVLAAASVREALVLLGKHEVQLAMVDLNLPGNEHLELLQQIRQQAPLLPVVVVTGHPSLPTAIAGLRLKISDYLLKPVAYEELVGVVRRFLPSPDGGSADGVHQTVLDSAAPAMQQVLAIARQVAPTDVNVLITGETGTGKEVVAREIHRLSRRGVAEFHPIDCAAIPEGLLESTLFGHVRGAFTGAVDRREGLLQQCHGGTAFLDEVGELPISLQVKFLRTIQNESFVPVGDHREVRIDTRFISATSRDLEREMSEGRFRRDLYYRLAVIHLKLPPLRDRAEDLATLTAGLFRSLRQSGQPAEDFSAEAWRALRAYHWPGNVRELRNVVERGLSLATGAEVGLAELPLEISGLVPAAGGASEAGARRVGGEFGDRVSAEREYFRDLLRECAGNVTRAARQAGMSRQGLHRALRRHGLLPDQYRRRGDFP